MTQEESEKIIKMFTEWEQGRGSFSCSDCKEKIGPASCHGYPVYSWGGFDPND